MSLADINRAAVDPDLIARAEAAAAQLGVASPTNFVAIQMRAIITQPTDTNPDQTLADVYAYKIATMPPAPKRPGEDESAVTDPMLLHAVQRVITKIHANLAPSSEPQPTGE